MITVFVDMVKAIMSIFKIPITILIALFMVFFIACMIHYIKSFIGGKRLKKGKHRAVKKHGLLRKIFWDAPKQYVADQFDRDPDFFKYQGLIIYEGRQGSGKSITMTYDTMMMQEEYPLAKCITNLAYKFQNDELDHWSKLVDYKNGIYGVIAVMDELQNWFSSNQSRNFPPEMLQTITQNRKNRRIILGTAQSFNLLAKPIRTQCTEVRKCSTFLGCITFVRKKEPYLDSEGNVKEWKNRGYYMFVHSKKLRDSYDTYKVIESLSSSGFKDELPEMVVNNYIPFPKK
ncbi:zonular occludens toxin domain-containing protein [Sedimentibacter sp.]|uniref:zonular occludens toxin domain-containing protein n=1 Tax=Sedimentibacter sp. TaxID=1960295 RepID=UPI0028AFF04D|nr:zonular occludens toxin domain-containing protein [Sedimentibacter sp.]